jgi:hypothetical protein
VFDFISMNIFWGSLWNANRWILTLLLLVLVRLV